MQIRQRHRVLADRVYLQSLSRDAISVDESGNWYTSEEVTQRAGVVPASIRGWTRSHGVQSMKIGNRVHYEREGVDRERANALAHFADVLDLRPNGTSPAAELGDSEQLVQTVLDLKSSIQNLETTLRQVVASRSAINESIQRTLTGEMVLLDALLSAAVSQEPFV